MKTCLGGLGELLKPKPGLFTEFLYHNERLKSPKINCLKSHIEAIFQEQFIPCGITHNHWRLTLLLEEMFFSKIEIVL